MMDEDFNLTNECYNKMPISKEELARQIKEAQNTLHETFNSAINDNPINALNDYILGLDDVYRELLTKLVNILGNKAFPDSVVSQLAQKNKIPFLSISIHPIFYTAKLSEINDIISVRRIADDTICSIDTSREITLIKDEQFYYLQCALINNVTNEVTRQFMHPDLVEIITEHES